VIDNILRASYCRAIKFLISFLGMGVRSRDRMTSSSGERTRQKVLCCMHGMQGLEKAVWMTTTDNRRRNGAIWQSKNGWCCARPTDMRILEHLMYSRSALKKRWSDGSMCFFQPLHTRLPDNSLFDVSLNLACATRHARHRGRAACFIFSDSVSLKVESI
jgi:hypothetical protein